MLLSSQAYIDFSAVYQQNYTGSTLDAQKSGLWFLRNLSSWCKMVAKWVQRALSLSHICVTVWHLAGCPRSMGEMQTRKTITNASENEALTVVNSIEPVSDVMLLCCRCAEIYSPYCTRFVWYVISLPAVVSGLEQMLFSRGGLRSASVLFFIESILVFTYTWHFKEVPPPPNFVDVPLRKL